MARFTKVSAALQQRAERFLPGGVDSPVRAFRAVGGHPPFVDRAEGATLIDADGNHYVDLFGSWGPMLLGHAFPPAVAAIREAAGRSASFGASTAAEADLAEAVTQCFPSIEKLRFVSSGTEACMSAIRLARGFTGRPFFIKFEGCYHGHSDALLVKAGSGLATFGLPGSAGVPPETVMHTLALPYNDLGAVAAAFAAHPDQIACVILEPVVGNAGTIAPQPGYLAGLRELTRRHGALLIFDEVMTGFRLAPGGAQELYGMASGSDAPDLTTLGKIIGGGLPCGAFGGRAEVMNLLAPTGPVYQAGTLSGNPLAMAAGLTTLKYLLQHRDEIYPQLEETTAAIADGGARLAQQLGVPLTTNRVGSMFTWFFTASPVTDFSSASTSDTAAFARFHSAMLEAGVWLATARYAAACSLGSIHSLPAIISAASMTVQMANTRRTLVCCARMPESSRPAICAEKIADITVEPTRPISSAGVSCWISVCEGTMMPAAEKPMRKQPKTVIATGRPTWTTTNAAYGAAASIAVPAAMPPRPRYTCSVLLTCLAKAFSTLTPTSRPTPIAALVRPKVLVEACSVSRT
jgi:glutamate-1-semialdehyde 2,1-aminomutase